MRRGSATKYHARRLQWLRERPGLMVGVPSMDEDVTEAGSEALGRLTEKMTGVGLIGTTPTAMRRETVRRLVGELRTGKVVNPEW